VEDRNLMIGLRLVANTDEADEEAARKQRRFANRLERALALYEQRARREGYAADILVAETSEGFSLHIAWPRPAGPQGKGVSKTIHLPVSEGVAFNEILTQAIALIDELTDGVWAGSETARVRRRSASSITS
jgi:hypothetical protein